MIELAQSTLWLELIAIIVSSIFYVALCYKKQNQNYLKFARVSYITFAAFSTLASFLLMYFFLTHDFRIEYVIKYSSSDLPLHYLISSFWAGQEGSFLLWIVLGAWLGVILLYKSRDAEPHIMALYNLQHIFLAILLIKQSPFATVPRPLEDGFGLNMLLQDPWMVIHPPIVFIGYAAFTIPFAIAMASLWRRKYNEWINQGLPWVAFAFVSLGAGIIIGGVWSYKVLGWGGYWGWDPVENASLLPWLTGIALLHGMILQKSTGRLAKTNYFLAAISFLLILYSTFLTRSGVLANFSVHTFGDLGITGWLVFFIFAFIFISGYFIIARAKEIPLPNKHQSKVNSVLSREFGLIAAIILLCLSALLTGIGTSAPLITRVMEKASKVSNQFYVNVNLPIAILIGLLLSYIPLLKWGDNNPAQIIRKLIVGIIAAIIVSIVTLINGFPGKLVFLMVVFAGFTVGVNLELVIKLIKKRFASSAGAMAHLGVGLMFIGFVASTGYDKSQRVQLPQGDVKTVFEYRMKFMEPRFSQQGKGTRYYMPIEIQKGTKIIWGQPDIYVEVKGNGEKQQFHHPFIKRGLWADLYISPEGYEPGKKESSSIKHLVIKKGETITFQDYKITFVQFDVSGMTAENTQHSMSVGADLVVSYKDNEPVSLKPIYLVGIKENPGSRVKLPGSQEAYLTLTGINADQKSIELHYDGPVMESSVKQDSAKPATLYAEVSIKPGMSILWIGVTLLLLGGAISIYRRLPRKE